LAATDVAVAAALLIVLTVTGLAAAMALRLPLSSTLLAAYVAVVVEVTLLTTVLSPFRLVTRTGLASGEAILLVAVVTVWWLRGRPRPGVGHLWALFRTSIRDPATALLFAAVVVALVYELVLGLTVPPNNWDSLTYHLTRAAAWAQHGGVYWIPNAPTDRINEFQPLAEQQLLFLFVATGKGALYALPQFVAELTILTAIYASARRVGFDVRRAMCSALLFACLPVVALEATTAQNDLVSAALVAAAGALLLGATSIELVLAGAATALGLGVKLTTALALPALLLLALARGRRAAGSFALAAVASFVLLGMWGFVLNLAETGHALGHGVSRLTQQASPSLTGSPATSFRVVFRLLDLTGLSDSVIALFAVVGIIAALATYLVGRRRGVEPAVAAAAAGAVILPLLAPRLVPGIASIFHLAANAVSLPVHARASTGGPFFWSVNRRVNEDLSGFGPLAGPALLIGSLIVLVLAARHRVGVRILALGLALPVFIVLLGLTSKYNPWIMRFLIVPVALAAPLLAALFRRRDVALAIAVVAVAGLAGVNLHNELKPLDGNGAYPWQLTQAAAASLTWQPQAGAADVSLAYALPASSCVGAALGADEPAYLIFGPQLGRTVTFLPLANTVSAARRDSLTAVVIGQVPGVAASFAAAGWRLQPLTGPPPPYWTLATAPTAAAARCPSA
jgi:Glycosyltransferase family 87